MDTPKTDLGTVDAGFDWDVGQPDFGAVADAGPQPVTRTVPAGTCL